MIRGGAVLVIIGIKLTINVMCLNHPEIIPHKVSGEITFHETGPWRQDLDHLFTLLVRFTEV